MNIVVVVILIAAIAAGVYFFVIKKKGSSGSTTSGVVLPTGWSITNSRNMPAQMTRASDGSYFFDFPSSDGVHYVVEPAPQLQMGQVVKLDFNVSGSGTVLPVQGDTAWVTLFMQRRGDNLTGSGPYQQYRYWGAKARLANGDGTASCTLTPDQWTDVFGKPGTDFQTAFQDCVANAEMIGMTFGDPGAGATGHGCYSSGGNRFTLKSFTIT